MLGRCSFTRFGFMRRTPEKFGEAMASSGLNDLVRSTRVLGCTSVSGEEGYRYTVKLPVKPQQGEPPLIGMYDPGTHEISTGPCYPEQSDNINKLLSFFPELLLEFGIEAFCEKTQAGWLRYVFVRQSSASGGFQLIFVVYDDSKKKKLESLCDHLKLDGFPILSVFMDLQQTKGNEIFAYDFVKVMGKEYLADAMGSIQFRIKPGSFFQSNPKGAAKIYRRIQSLVGQGKGNGAIDLYCGVGPISLHLAEVGYRVLGVEEVAEAVDSAQQNSRLNSYGNQLGLVCSDVGEFFRHGFHTQGLDFFSSGDREIAQDVWKKVSWITLNPSRKGLGEDVCTSILEDVPPHVRFVYMSCDASSLVKDLKILKDGGVEVKQLEAFDLFPGTDHLEWLAVLEKKGT